MIKLSHLIKNVRTITHGEGESELVVTYAPGKVTKRVLASFRDDADATPYDEVIKFLAVCLVGWNLCLDDGEPVPVSETGLADVPLEILFLVNRLIGEDMSGDPKAMISSGS